MQAVANDDNKKPLNKIWINIALQIVAICRKRKLRRYYGRTLQLVNLPFCASNRKLFEDWRHFSDQVSFFQANPRFPSTSYIARTNSQCAYFAAMFIGPPCRFKITIENPEKNQQTRQDRMKYFGGICTSCKSTKDSATNAGRLV